MKIISRKKYIAWQNELFDYISENHVLREKIKELESDQKNNDDFLQHILSFKSNSLEAIVKNKEEKICYLIKSEDEKNLEFYLYDMSNKKICSNILTTKSIKYDLVDNSFEKQFKYIYIDDFYSIEENIGNGSILMSYLLDYIENKEFKYITGYLAEVDSYNREKQEYFYKKYSFEISYTNEDKKEGKILLYLNNKSF